LRSRCAPAAFPLRPRCPSAAVPAARPLRPNFLAAPEPIFWRQFHTFDSCRSSPFFETCCRPSAVPVRVLWAPATFCAPVAPTPILPAPELLFRCARSFSGCAQTVFPLRLNCFPAAPELLGWARAHFMTTVSHFYRFGSSQVCKRRLM